MLWQVNLHICTGSLHPSLLNTGTSTKSNGLTTLIYSLVTTNSILFDLKYVNNYKAAVLYQR